MIEAAKDEPTMADILACVRRILMEDEAKQAHPPAGAGERPLVLTNMVAADGSIVMIAPVLTPKFRPVPVVPLDPFARLDLLKGRVATLLAIGPPQPELPSDSSGAQKFATALLTAASFILPASIARHIPGMATKSEGCIIDKAQSPCRPVGGQAAHAVPGKADSRLDRVRTASDTVDAASLHLSPIDAPGTATGGAVERRAARNFSLDLVGLQKPGNRRTTRKAALSDAGNSSSRGTEAPRESNPDQALVGTMTAFSRLLGHTEADRAELTLEAARNLEPRQQLELMLARQIAAAHGAAMTLTRAAVHSVHERAESVGDAEADTSGIRGRKRTGRRRTANADAARLANSAARLMQVYNKGLATLAKLRADEQPRVTVQSRVVAEVAPPIVPLRIVDAGTRRGSENSGGQAPTRQSMAARRRRRSASRRAVTH